MNFLVVGVTQTHSSNKTAFLIIFLYLAHFGACFFFFPPHNFLFFFRTLLLLHLSLLKILVFQSLVQTALLIILISPGINRYIPIPVFIGCLLSIYFSIFIYRLIFRKALPFSFPLCSSLLIQSIWLPGSQFGFPAPWQRRGYHRLSHWPRGGMVQFWVTKPP